MAVVSRKSIGAICEERNVLHDTNCMGVKPCGQHVIVHFKLRVCAYVYSSCDIVFGLGILYYIEGMAR